MNWFEANPKKTILFIILFLLVAPLIAAELFAKTYIHITQGRSAPLFYYSPQQNETTQARAESGCDLSFLDPLLGYSISECSGYPEKRQGGLVVYGGEPVPEAYVIVTLGGSTTDPFHMQVREDIQEKTWPYLLHQNCTPVEKCVVVNAGVGGYSSSQELFRLIRDGLMVSPDVVISLNGINEWYYYISDDYRRFPYVSRYQQDTFRALGGASLDGRSDVDRFGQRNTRILPNAQELFLVAMRKFRTLLTGADPVGAAFDPADFGLYFGFENKGPEALAPWEIWARNVTLMHAVAGAVGAEYRVVLQPTMGVGAWEPQADGDIELFENMRDNYLPQIRDFYTKARQACASMDFCIDGTDAFVGHAGELYSDARHPNAAGNKIIADLVWNALR
ncbi:MAG: hypothetical protein RIC16_16760 [Rhodospirillales bacterium]